MEETFAKRKGEITHASPFQKALTSYEKVT
jgi:hypothetical protein